MSCLTVDALAAFWMMVTHLLSPSTLIPALSAGVAPPYWYFPTEVTLLLGGPVLAVASLGAMACSLLGRKRTTSRGAPN